jgi:hypothetical protein
MPGRAVDRLADLGELPVGLDDRAPRVPEKSPRWIVTLE